MEGFGWSKIWPNVSGKVLVGFKFRGFCVDHFSQLLPLACSKEVFKVEDV